MLTKNKKAATVATSKSEAKPTAKKPSAKKAVTPLNHLLEKQNMSTEQTPEQIAAKKAADAQAKKDAAALAKKEAAAKKEADKKAKEEADKIKKDEAAKAKAEADAKRPEQNGVKKPAEGSKALEIWDTADKLTFGKGSPVSLKELTDAMAEKGYSASTVFSEYGKWRKFNNITGRIEDPAKAAERAAKAEADAKAKAEREAKKGAKITQNDVTRPAADSKTGKVWEIADNLSSTKGSPVSLSELKAETDKIGANPNMVSSQYASWRKFYGIRGRVEDPSKSGKSLEKLEAQAKSLTDKIAKLQASLTEVNEKIAKATPAASDAV